MEYHQITVDVSHLRTSIFSQQPLHLRLGVGVPISCQNIARTIVGIGVGGVTRSTEQLAPVVVGVVNGAFSRGRIGGDVAFT